MHWRLDEMVGARDRNDLPKEQVETRLHVAMFHSSEYVDPREHMAHSLSADDVAFRSTYLPTSQRDHGVHTNAVVLFEYLLAPHAVHTRAEVGVCAVVACLPAGQSCTVEHCIHNGMSGRWNSLSRTHTHTHTRTIECSLSHARTHTHTHTHAPALFLSLTDMDIHIQKIHLNSTHPRTLRSVVGVSGALWYSVAPQITASRQTRSVVGVNGAS